MHPLKLREDWLNAMSSKLAPWFESAGFPLPPYRASCGFPSAGKKGRAIGECWSEKCSGDAHHEIFIHPNQADSLGVAAILAHELIHAAVGLSHKHSGEFKRLAIKIGLEGPMKATHAGEKFVALVHPFLEGLGDYPHACLNSSQGVTSGEPKQTTRLLKVVCPDCGYTVRTTQKWIVAGMPVCPCGAEMQVV